MKSDNKPRIFQPDERWCATGDSLTQGGHYHQYVQLYYATRFPGNRLELLNCGINGDTTARVLARLDADVLSHKPTLVSILLGFNDISETFPDGTTASEIHNERAKLVAAYGSGLIAILKRVHEAGARCVLITPGLYDETMINPKAVAVNPGIMATLLDCAAVVEELGIDYGVPVIDWTKPLAHWNAELQKTDPAATLINMDRVHPGEPGSFAMAYEFLKAQGVPREISRIVVNATTGQAGDSLGCSVTNIKKGADTIAFDCVEKSLPFPIPETCRSTLAFLPFVAELNIETLKIEGLKVGTYELRIDGKVIRSYSAKQLRAGVNLAEEVSTPQYQQAEKVAELVARRSDIYRSKLRTIAEMEWCFLKDIDRSGKTPAELKALLDGRIDAFKIEHKMTDGWHDFIKTQAKRYEESKPLEAKYLTEVNDLQNEIYRANKPATHRLEITPKS